MNKRIMGFMKIVLITCLLSQSIYALQCPVCNTANDDSSKFCTSCGKKFEIKKKGPVYCTECGTENLPNNKYCSTCGETLSKSTKLSRPSYQAQQEMYQDNTNDAVSQAKIDAGADVDTTCWSISGFLFGIFTVIFAYIYDPSPPAHRLVGKTSTYLSSYLEVYKQESKSKRQKSAWSGCVTAGVLNLIILVASN